MAGGMFQMTRGRTRGTIQIDGRTQRSIDACLRDLKRYQAGMKRGAIQRAADAFGKELRDHISKSAATEFGSNRAGGLAKSWKVRRLKKIAGATGVRIFSNKPYARIQNQGGIIKPRKSGIKYLAIPLNPEAKRAKSPRKFNNLVVRRFGHDLLQMKRVGRRLKPMFLLKERVRVTGKRYIEKGIRRGLKPARRYFIRVLEMERNKAFAKR